MSNRRIPFGKRLDAAGRLVKDPKEWQIVEEILTDTALGLGPEAIATGLNKSGAKTKRGGKWHGSTVRKIIEAYRDVKIALPWDKRSHGKPLPFPPLTDPDSELDAISEGGKDEPDPREPKWWPSKKQTLK